MSRGSRWAAGAALICLLLAMVLASRDDKALTRTSYGRTPAAFAGVYELLSELGLAVSRNLRPATELDTVAPLWWIAAPVICTDSETMGPDSWSLLDWVHAGGTAVVALPAPDLGSCHSVAGLDLPRRSDDGMCAADGLPLVSGPLVPRVRRLAPEDALSFADAGGWIVVARLGDVPFVLEQPLGSGRLVVVADARFLRNQWLDQLDNAVFALDLARAYGAPVFDEHSHGFRLHDNAATYLAASPAGIVFASLALLAFLYIWRSRLLPERRSRGRETGVPVLTAYVDSLAGLLAANRDHDRALAAYCDVTAARLRRHFGLPPGVPLPVLASRVRATGRVTEEAMQLFVGGGVARRGGDVRRGARVLDGLLWEVTR
mgnify:CR=1 FL=1